MRRWMLAATAVALCAAAPARAAGPYGFEMGMTLKQVKARGLAPKALEQPDTWRTSSAPRPDPAFEGYLLRIDPKLGLVAVTAVGKDIPTGPTGLALRTQFWKHAARLKARYGEPQTYDGLEPGSTLTEPEDWMAALVVDERALALFWGVEPEPDDRPLPDHLARVALLACADRPGQGFLKITFEFTNQAAAEAAGAEAEAETL